MKKLFSVLLAVLLLASLCGSAFAAVDTDEAIWKATESGFEMQIPDALRDAKGYITFSDGGEGMDPGSGVVVAVTNYICMPWEEYNALAGTQLAFETTDLEGKPLSSEEIFAGHAITMINMWATWCDPCKDELPELAAMAEEFEKQGCQIIGMCLDAEDDETMAEGRAILEEAGVSYLNIVPFEGREEILPNKFYPTTYFVDENGVILDEIVIGAAVEQYPQSLAKLLAKQAAVS